MPNGRAQRRQEERRETKLKSGLVVPTHVAPQDELLALVLTGDKDGQKKVHPIRGIGDVFISLPQEKDHFYAVERLIREWTEMSKKFVLCPKCKYRGDDVGECKGAGIETKGHMACNEYDEREDWQDEDRTEEG